MFHIQVPKAPRSRAGNAIELPHARPGRIIGPHGAMGDLWRRELRTSGWELMEKKQGLDGSDSRYSSNHRIHERFLQGFTGALICHDLHSENWTALTQTKVH